MSWKKTGVEYVILERSHSWWSSWSWRRRTRVRSLRNLLPREVALQSWLEGAAVAAKEPSRAEPSRLVAWEQEGCRKDHLRARSSVDRNRKRSLSVCREETKSLSCAESFLLWSRAWSAASTRSIDSWLPDVFCGNLGMCAIWKGRIVDHLTLMSANQQLEQLSLGLPLPTTSFQGWLTQGNPPPCAEDTAPKEERKLDAVLRETQVGYVRDVLTKTLPPEFIRVHLDLFIHGKVSEIWQCARSEYGKSSPKLVVNALKALMNALEADFDNFTSWLDDLKEKQDVVNGESWMVLRDNIVSSELLWVMVLGSLPQPEAAGRTNPFGAEDWLLGHFGGKSKRGILAESELPTAAAADRHPRTKGKHTRPSVKNTPRAFMRLTQ